MSIKTQRIASNIIKELSYILAYEVKDEDIKFVTVTDCRLAPDLSYAKVYVTVFDKNKIESTMKAWKYANGFIRRELSNRIDIRHTPELDFVYDESIEYGKKIEEIIEDIHNEQ